jgi:maltose alpha-D-glucosyltransferase/alpha-amylase
MWEHYAPEPRMRQNLGIRRRLAPLLEGATRRIELAHALLFALPGTPIFYYGDEIGMGDNIWLDDRDGVRTPFQWDATTNAGFSPAPPEKLYSPVIAEGEFGYQTVNLKAQQADPGSLWHRLRRLVEVRKSQPAFGSSDYEFLETGNAAVLGIARRHPGGTIVALFNLSPAPQQIEVNWRTAWGSGSRPAVDDLLEPGQARPAPVGSLELPAFGYRWLRLAA